MTLESLLLVPVALGHLSLFVVVVNVVHAFGMTERRMGWVKLLLPTVFLLIGISLCYAAFQGGWGAWSWPVQAYAALCLVTALIGLPIASLLRAFRRSPGTISERSSELNLTALEGKASLIGNGRHSWLLRIPGNESLRLCRREWDITLPFLPPVWDGLRLVHVTDLHFAPCFHRRFFERVIDEAGAWEADLVLFTGDLIDHDDALDWIIPVMSRLRGRLGRFAILGNHDYDHDPRRIRRLLEEAGFTDLEGRWDRLEVEGKTLALGGTSAPWGPRLDLRAEADADFRLLLSHSPDLFYRAAASSIDLMLSGHNHGGQIRVPGIGPIFMPSVYSRRFDRGFFQTGKTLMHVSQGVAGKHPVRFRCVPEIGRLVLRRPREFAAPHATALTRTSRETPDSLLLP